MATTGFLPNRVNVRFTNNTGSGFRGDIQVDPGTTLKQFFVSQMGTGANPASYIIMVNELQGRTDYVLAEGDRVAISPTNVKGA